MFKAIVQQVISGNLASTIGSDMADRFRKLQQIESGTKPRQEVAEADLRNREEALLEKEQDLRERERLVKEKHEEIVKKEEKMKAEVQLYQGAFAAEEEFTRHQLYRLDSYKEAEEMFTARSDELEDEVVELRGEVAEKDLVIENLGRRLVTMAGEHEEKEKLFESRIQELEATLGMARKAISALEGDNLMLRRKLEAIFKLSQL